MIGNRASGEQSRLGIQRAIWSRVRNCASMPFRRIALPRRIAASMSAGEWTRLSTPRALYITLKLSSCDKPLPQLQRELVEVRVRIEVIVGADDRRVAPGIAAAEPALFEHGDIGDAVLLRKIVGGGEAVTAAADDDDVVARLRRRAAPGAAASARGTRGRCGRGRRSSTSRGRAVVGADQARMLRISGPRRIASFLWPQGYARPLARPRRTDWRN